MRRIQEGSASFRAAAAEVLPTRHPSQLYAGVLEGLVTFLVLLWLWRKPRRRGLIGAAFCLCYAAMRLVNEQFRQPDAHIGFEALGLTRGQWLSVPLALTGLIGAAVILYRRLDPMGGWLPVETVQGRPIQPQRAQRHRGTEEGN